MTEFSMRSSNASDPTPQLNIEEISFGWIEKRLQSLPFAVSGTIFVDESIPFGVYVKIKQFVNSVSVMQTIPFER